MSSPLSEVDTNARSPDFEPAQVTKMPTPPTLQRTSSAGRHSPFSVSATGSPRYVVTAPSSKRPRSPTATSKIPRRSQTPTFPATSKAHKPSGGVESQRLGLPKRAGRRPPVIGTPFVLGPKKSTPPSLHNKPLPSPPIAQVIDPNSPLRAHRTLIDAESGSPSENEWPILRPENVPPLNISSPVNCLEGQQRSVSEGAAPQQMAHSFFANKRTRSTIVQKTGIHSKMRNSSGLATSGTSPNSSKLMQMTEPRSLNSKNPYTMFHAISTKTEMAMASPLSHKKSAPAKVAIPPRLSSNRSSLPLPLPNQNKPDSPTLPPSLQPHRTQACGTKGPMLDENGLKEVVTETTFSSQKQHSITTSLHSSQPEHEQDTLPHVSQSTSASCDGRSHHDSLNSSSDWSMAAGSSLDSEPGRDVGGSFRTRRLSRRSLNSGPGPVLTIFEDADEVLLGPSPSIPAVPALPGGLSQKLLPERSLATLAKRISSQTKTRISGGIAPRSPTPTSVEAPRNRSSSIKVDPIRSMQPPRDVSSGNVPSSLSPSTLCTASTLERVSKTPPMTLTTKRIASDSSQMTITQATSSGAMISEISSNPGFSGSAPNSKMDGDRFIASTPVPLKAEKVFGIVKETPPSAARKDLPTNWMSATISSSLSRKSGSLRSKTSPSFSPAGRRTNRDAASSSSTSHSSSPTPSRTTQSNDAGRHLGPSKLRSSVSVTPIRSQTSSGLDSPLNHQKEFECTARVWASSSPSDESTKKFASKNKKDKEEGTTKKIRIKRSFRDIFHRRDVKRSEKQPKEEEPKRSSVVAVGSTLAKRIRDSKSLSKVQTSRMSETLADILTARESEGSIVDGREAALASLEATSSGPEKELPTVSSYDTVTVISNIIDRVTSMSPDSPDRLRGLEIAEAVLHSVECYKEARLSAEEAKKHARDAELNAERAGVELARLQKLCEPNLDPETLLAIKELLRQAGRIGGKDDVLIDGAASVE